VYNDLATVAAPTIETQSVCGEGGRNGTGASKATGGATSNATTVIQKGQVGIFDWALLRASSSDSFTAWLKTNGFPYQASATEIFDQYVKEAWYFIAFKVSVGSNVAGVGGNSSSGTGTTSITSGQTLCGNFGPISLAFPREEAPVVPARIAAVSSSQLTWTLYTLASRRLRIRDQSATLRFAGPINSDILSQRPSLATVAQAGDRLSELQATLNPATAKDLVLEADPDQADYRRTETRNVYVYCPTGGRTSTSLDIGGMSPIGGYTAAGGALSVGGFSAAAGASTGGNVATGGVSLAATGGAGYALTHAPIDTRPHDDGGCAVTGTSSGRSRFGMMLLVVGGLLLRRRRSAAR
jgi:MYXO-CTERM domain-containing protein